MVLEHGQSTQLRQGSKFQALLRLKRQVEPDSYGIAVEAKSDAFFQRVKNNLKWDHLPC